MKQTLEEYQKQQKHLLEEMNKLVNKGLTTRTKVLYLVGLIGTMIVSTIVFYPENIPLAWSVTIGCGVGVPCLSALIDKIKYEKLKSNVEILNKNIEELENEIQEQTVTEEERKKQILFSSYPPLKVTEETRRAVLEHPELHSGLSVRARMGKFYTDEEWEQRREEVLNAPLLGDKPKKFTRKRKR